VSRVAVKAAYRSADILRSRIGHLSTVAKKGPIDLVTDADLASEAEIVRTIREVFPEHAIVAEESGTQAGASSDHRWIVDPLDGTVNYAHQVPFFAVSIAYAFRDAVQVGVVLNPLDGELFSAVEGAGARLNGQPIRVSPPEAELSESLLATGFPYDLEADFDALGARFLRCLRRARGVRRLGSAALDLCYVACGRFAIGIACSRGTRRPGRCWCARPAGRSPIFRTTRWGRRYATSSPPTGGFTRSCCRSWR